MIILKFDTSDLPEDSKEYYNDLEVKFSDMSGESIDKHIECFRTFLIALTFPPSLVDKYLITEDEYEEEEERDYYEGDEPSICRESAEDIIKDIACELDYDISKQLDKETAEEPDKVEERMDELVETLNAHIKVEEPDGVSPQTAEIMLLNEKLAKAHTEVMLLNDKLSEAHSQLEILNDATRSKHPIEKLAEEAKNAEDKFVKAEDTDIPRDTKPVTKKK